MLYANYSVFQLFFANLSYQEAFKNAEADLESDSKTGVVKVLSSTSGLFTLVLAAIFPSTSGDRLTLSKFVAVAFRYGFNWPGDLLLYPPMNVLGGGGGGYFGLVIVSLPHLKAHQYSQLQSGCMFYSLQWP